MDEEKNSEEPLMNPNEVHEANVLNNTDAIILCDETGSVKYQNKSVTLTLTRTSLILESIKKRSSELTLSLSSFIGATIRNDGKYAGKVLLIHLFAHPSRSCCSCCSSGSGKRKHSTVDLLFTNDRDCMNWMNAINTILCQSTLTRDKEGMIQPPPSRRYLVFVNPVGGTGIAVQIWNRVSIFLTQASIEYELLITERANHAKDVMTSRNLDDIHAVVIIGGDGLVFEVISGVLARHDSEKQFQRLIFAPVPGGSGNGLIKSILHESGEDYSPENAIFVAVRGKPALLDLSQVLCIVSYFSFIYDRYKLGVMGTLVS